MKREHEAAHEEAPLWKKVMFGLPLQPPEVTHFKIFLKPFFSDLKACPLTLCFVRNSIKSYQKDLKCMLQENKRMNCNHRLKIFPTTYEPTKLKKSMNLLLTSWSLKENVPRIEVVTTGLKPIS